MNKCDLNIIRKSANPRKLKYTMLGFSFRTYHIAPWEVALLELLLLRLQMFLDAIGNAAVLHPNNRRSRTPQICKQRYHKVSLASIIN